MSATSPVRFFFDFVSPYAYVAWTQIGAICSRNKRALAPVPVLFAGLLGAHGTKGPAEVPAKRAYVFKDAFRKAHHAGLPTLVPPPSHPFNPLVALRVASLPMDEGARVRLIDALYSAAWAGGGGVESKEKVAAIARAAGLDGDALLSNAETTDAKDRLRAQTDDAIAHGVFGVPSMIADEELFWGVDALPSLETFLRGEDPVPKDLLSRWAHLPASATRKI